MDTPSPYKRATTCSGKNIQTIAETVPKYNNRSFAIIITGVHFYEPKRRYITKYDQPKEVRPCIAKGTMSVKIVMYVIFFTNQGHSIQIAVPKGKSVNAKFCKGKVLHKLNKYFKNRSPWC
jgi:hypothetical protein